MRGPDGRFLKGEKHPPLSEKGRERLRRSKLGKKRKLSTRLAISLAHIGRPGHTKGKKQNKEKLRENAIAKDPKAWLWDALKNE